MEVRRALSLYLKSPLNLALAGAAGGIVLLALLFAPGGLIKEPGGGGEHGYVVLRRKTSGRGYHTTAKDCERLFQRVIEEIGNL